LRVLTWHVHGSYLQYLARAPHDFYLPVRPGRPEGYAGRGRDTWPENLIEVDAGDVPRLELDLVLSQSHRNWLHDRRELLSERQLAVPQVHLEHDPPRESPTDTRHPAAGEADLIVHCTPFNALMWDSGAAPTVVVDHGVAVPDGVGWTGELERGLVVVNNLGRRGRRLGLDVFERVRAEVPLDLVGMGSEELGGLGEVPHEELPAFAARYRFLFNPIRWTSLGLAVLEAMTIGMPVVALATTEYATAIEDGVSGFVDTDVGALVDRMRLLLADRETAARLGAGARARALERFSIDRFAADWDRVLREASTPRSAARAA
jgi:glycosyltransferase involved in cell wall biosynthesis